LVSYPDPEVRVMLKVDRKTNCLGIDWRIDLFWRDVQSLYLPDMMSD
jgi:hypothetical protein